MNPNAIKKVDPQPGTVDHPDGQTVNARPVYEMSGDTMTAASTAQIIAMMRMREDTAMRRPRSFNKVHADLMEECRRPSFADSAIYEIERGKKKDGSPNIISGLSIRFAEAAIRCMGNIMVLDQIVNETKTQRTIRIIVLDLESNTDYGTETMIDKTVERKKGSSYGREIVGQRMTSNNEIVNVCVATEDEIAQKKGSAVSKAIRNAALRILPGDIQEDAEAEIHKTLNSEYVKSPDEAIKKLIANLGRVGVPEAEVRRWVGGNPFEMNERQYQELRNVGAAIRDKQTTWAEFFAPDPNGANGTVENTEKKGNAKLQQNLGLPAASKTASEEIKAPAKREQEPAPRDDEGRDNDGSDSFLGG